MNHNMFFFKYSLFFNAPGIPIEIIYHLQKALPQKLHTWLSCIPHEVLTSRDILTCWLLQDHFKIILCS